MQVGRPKCPTLNCVRIIVQKILPAMPGRREMLAERKEGRRKEGEGRKGKGKEEREECWQQCWGKQRVRGMWEPPFIGSVSSIHQP